MSLFVYPQTSGSGNVVGPGSSTDNAVVRFDGTTGKLLQNSTVIVDDSGNVSGAANIAATSATISGLTVSTAVVTDGSKNLASSTTTSTELGYVHGVTSALQTQLNAKQPLDSTLTALAAYNTNGLLAQTAADTFAGRTITGTANQVSVSNGDGVAGNPTLSTPQNIHSGASPTFVTTVLSGLTASTAVVADASKNLVSSATTSTELGYVSGVTSAIQTQLNGKQATGNYITALTGDVTASGAGSAAATIANGVVTNAKMANVSTATFKGRTTAGTGSPEDLTVTQATALLNVVVGDSGSGGTKGLVPAAGSGDAAAGKYLGAGGTFSVPPGTGLTALTGDVTASGSGSQAATLATVNSNVGSFGSSTSIPNFTVNGKGLITAAGGNSVIAPASTLSGTVLNSTVVSSSLTSVGTIASGVWNGTTIAVANGGTAVTSVTTAPAATAFAGWDANKNLSANNHIEGYATTATGAGTTTLVVGDKALQYFTGSTTQTVVLPVTSTLVLGHQFIIVNNSTGVVTVQSSGANAIQAMVANSSATFTCILTSGTTAASWSIAYVPSFLSTNTASTAVARDGSGNFSAATITAALTGTASGNTTYTANNHGIVVSGAANAMTVVAPNSSTAFPLISGGASADPAWAKLSEAGGGTNQTAYTTGDVLYASGTNTLAKLAIGSTNNILTVSGGVPAWAAAPASAPVVTVVTKSANYTAVANDYVLGSASGAWTLTLPTAVGISGQSITLKRTDNAPTNIITINTTSAQTIDGASSVHAITQYEVWKFVSDGANWSTAEHRATTPWNNSLSFTPNSFGTTTNNFWTRRMGDSLEVQGWFTSGTTTAATASLTLPVTIDSAKLPNSSGGTLLTLYANTNGAGTVAANGVLNTVFYDGSDTAKVYLGYQVQNSPQSYLKNNASLFAVSGNILSFHFTIPVSGWEA